MSVRLMKKILKEQEPAEPQQLNSENESESPPSSTAFRNPFDLLDEEDDGVDQSVRKMLEDAADEVCGLVLGNRDFDLINHVNFILG
ncbi:hypothetical protein HAX54_020455 [Datura stramonium]|uniref:Uncharacterized protein n=1 Tax=Datura stramonium TaxID=4076 RepID=A0ABS8S4X5_DATST|nr:hypothetical protein [Datura stramonium]